MSTISLSSPAMSDKTLLLSVEDLISIAMGPQDGNTVNFKMVQTILHILARQMRVLEQKVIVVAGELPSEGKRMGSRLVASRHDELYRRRTPPEFETEEERLAWEREEDERLQLTRRRSSARSRSRILKGKSRSRVRSLGEDGRDGGRDGSGGARRGRESSADVGGQRRGRRSRAGREQDDDQGGRGRSGGREGRDRHDDGDERGGRGRAGGRGGRDEGDDRGGRGGAGGRGGRDDDEGGARGRAEGRGGRDDDDEGVHGKAGGRGGRDEEDERGGRGKAGGRGGRDEDDDRGGRGRAGGREGFDDDERGGRGRAGGRGGRDDDVEGGGGGYDRDDDGRGGRDRAGGRGGQGRDDDEGRGGRDKAGRRDQDVDRGSAAGGRGSGGERGGLDEDKGRGRGEPTGGSDERGGPGGKGAKGGKDEAGKQGIGVREVSGPGKEKLLVVEKGSTTGGGARDRADSIAVVTQSQFRLLEDQVDELWRAAGPLPALKMPDNKQLREDLAAGASLTDAMQAMQVSARVQAAEQAITKLGGLLTQLAASGALPEDAADAVMAGGWMDEDEGMQMMSSTGTGYKSVQVDPSPKGGLPGQAGRPGGPPQSSSKTSVSAGAYITKPEMGTALVKLREEVTKTLCGQIERAATAAETAEKTAHDVGEKVEGLLRMDSRLTSMYSLVEDYSEQLAGFDAGLNTQMASFKEQMTTMRAELEEGLLQLDTSNNNPETAAVMELNERFDGLVRGLDDTLLQHTALNKMQTQLTQELKTLMEAVEMLREQKADRDELLDILRDKADVTMLEGLVRLEEFDRAQADLEQRLDKCNDKFKCQDDVWMTAMKDLKEIADTKAQMMDLLKVRDEATTQLRAIDDRIDQLSLILGEPKAAMLMRKLARDAVCGACLTPAMMDPGLEPAPPLLPAARGPQLVPPSAPEPKALDYPDFRTHRCHRWVGGSHTLIPLVRAHATPIDVPDVTKKYTGYGSDGRMYWMEAEMEPCVECNPEVSAPPTTARTDVGTGAGDACQC